eukprot:g13124.t1
MLTLDVESEGGCCAMMRDTIAPEPSNSWRKVFIEERHLYMPKAGQQELAVDPAALERSIEDQLQHLRQITLSGPVSETPQAAAAARSSPPTDFEVVDDAVKSPMCFTAVD